MDILRLWKLIKILYNFLSFQLKVNNNAYVWVSLKSMSEDPFKRNQTDLYVLIIEECILQ